ncbi:MAG: hypothetical protein RL518_918 [Pseudomonadota bacterium]|jgi:hypothetical protein
MKQTGHTPNDSRSSLPREPDAALSNEFLKELRMITSAVDRKGGEIVHLSPTSELSPELASALQDVKSIVTGTRLRPEGLTLYSTQSPPSEEVLREVMAIISLDKGSLSSYIRNFFRASHDSQPVWGDAKRLYHSSLLLDYLVMRHVGWIDPMDREWFLTEKGGAPTDAYGCDYGFSLSRSLKAALDYGEPHFGGSFVEKLYRACGRELPHALGELRDQTVVLGMDAVGLKSAFPSGKVLWTGTETEHEVCCPLLPADLPEVGLAPIAIVRWRPRHSR